MAKKQATPAKAPLSTRFGRLVAKHGPGTAVKLGRLSKKAGSGIASSASKFRDGFVQGWEEV